MKKINRFLLFLIILDVFVLFSISGVEAQTKYNLYITYRLPTNQDHKNLASTLVSGCTTKYAVCMQGCQIGDGKVDCKNRCELAFRGCLFGLGSKGVKFWLAVCKEGGCETVGNAINKIIPLTREEALDIRLNDEFNAITQNYYSKTGTYATASSGNCTFRRTRDDVEISFDGSNIIGQAISNHYKDPDKSALYLAIKNGQNSLMESLLSRGVDVDESGSNLTALQEAVKMNNMDLVKLLLEHGASIDKIPSGFRTSDSPLGIALGNNNIPMMEFLISKGANVNGKYFSGESYLGQQVANGNLSVIKIFIQNGADINSINYSNETPLDLAEKNNHKEVAAYLRSNGAKNGTDPLKTPTFKPEKTGTGTQVWMGKNLNVSKFRNGDVIPEAKTIVEWKKSYENKKPAWCYYDNDPVNGKKYGKLYNWYAVNDSRGLAPKGWHVPSITEWITLTEYLGGSRVAEPKIKNTSGWKYDKNKSTNASGFAGLPGGMRSDIFNYIDQVGYWWSSTAGDSPYLARSWAVGYDFSGQQSYKHSFLSVRCLKD